MVQVVRHRTYVHYKMRVVHMIPNAVAFNPGKQEYLFELLLNCKLYEKVIILV